MEFSGSVNAGMRLHAPSISETIVATQRIDVIVGDRKVDVIKIDIEGHEYSAMLGAAELLSRCHPTIFTEYSSDFQRVGSGVDGTTYLRLLLDYGYRISILRDTGPEAIQLDDVDTEWRKAPTHIDLLLEYV
jgi:hypothetical protein